MEIYSPDDCFVLTVKAPGVVNTGDQLITVYSPELEKLFDRVRMHKEELEIHARRFSDADGRLAEWKALQNEIFGQLKKQREMQLFLYKTVKDQFEAGIVTR